MKPGFKIEVIHTFIVTEDDGTEGVPAIDLGGVMHPLIAADPERLKSLRPIARQIAEMSGKKITLARFSVREDLGDA